jgi:NAD+ synthetase
MRLTLAQLDPIVGDVSGNTRLVLDAIGQARRDRSDLLVAGELGLIGYPPRDLLFRAGVVEAAERAVAQIARASRDIAVVVGHPRRCRGGTRPFCNSVSICARGRVEAVYDKRLLPGYDVFDEDRYFQPGDRPCVVNIGGRRVGVLICEDLWRAGDVLAPGTYASEPLAETAPRCELLVVPNASPFVLGKWQRHLEQMRAAVDLYRIPVVTVHQVGANDDLIFDGRSIALDADGTILTLLPAWEPALRTIDLAQRPAQRLDLPAGMLEPAAELFGALCLGIRDYCRKTGYAEVLVGLSGGIDSAVVACLAAAALGPRGCTGLMMPSRYTSPASREDAEALAANLGLTVAEPLSIEAAHGVLRVALEPALGARAGGVTDENIQARLRGLLLMAFANARGALVLATGNKSEFATGYCTIYGDMCGALAVLGDVVKTRVYALARWMNDNHAACGFPRPPIPARCFTRAPSAELRPDQTDQDTLPPYERLDPIVERFVEREQSIRQIAEETGFDPAFVEATVRMIDRAQYKRDQAAPILKVTPRTFGRGRPMPIAMRWTESPSEVSAAGRRPGEDEPGAGRRRAVATETCAQEAARRRQAPPEPAAASEGSQPPCAPRNADAAPGPEATAGARAASRPVAERGD